MPDGFNSTWQHTETICPLVRICSMIWSIFFVFQSNHIDVFVWNSIMYFTKRQHRYTRNTARCQLPWPNMETVAIKIVERVILCDGFYCLVAFRFLFLLANQTTRGFTINGHSPNCEGTPPMIRSWVSPFLPCSSLSVLLVARSLGNWQHTP